MLDGGIIPLWKERGVYSQRYITKIRKLLAIKKVGHSGTLDPEVDGVLPIAFGKGTKVLEYMLDSDKIYRGRVTLGWSTSTEDQTGEKISESKIKKEQFSEADIDQVLNSFLGDSVQIPPMYSAVRVNGKRLYEYARQGIEVERPSRHIHIFQLKRQSALDYNSKEQSLSFDFQVRCSKGTYIRTLAVDIGRRLGLAAHMSRLTRVESAGITASQAVRFEELEQAQQRDELEQYILPLEHFLKDFPFIEISQDLSQRVNHGNQLKRSNFVFDQLDQAVVLAYGGKAQAIYHPNSKDPSWLKPLKMIRQF